MGVLAAMEAAVKKPVFGCQHVRPVRPALDRHDLPDELPEDAPKRPLRRRPRRRRLRGEARDALRVAARVRALAAAAAAAGRVARRVRPSAPARRQPPARHRRRGATWPAGATGRRPRAGRPASIEPARAGPRRRGGSWSPPRCRRSTAAAWTRCASSSTPMAPYLDACNATDNTAAHAHASPLADRGRPPAVRDGADHAARLPRPQPARASRPRSSARRCTGSRTCAA